MQRRRRVAVVRSLPRLLQQLRRVARGVQRGLGVRRLDRLRRLSRRQSHERRFAVLRRERGDAVDGHESVWSTRGSIRRALTRATRSSTTASRVATAPASCSSTRSAKKIGVGRRRVAHRSRLHHRAARRRLAVVRAGAHRRDHGAVFDQAGRRSHVDRQGAIDGSRRRHRSKRFQATPTSFRVQKADGVHFAAARVAFVGATYVVFDWSYQSATGNPELNVMPSQRQSCE